MRLIVGLGNPGSKYDGSRHNVGFEVLDALAEKHGLSMTQKKFSSLFVKGRLDRAEAILAKPQTFMNLSGRAVREIMDYFNIDPSDLIVVHDDMDLEVGRIKITAQGGPGGHNGAASIIDSLKTKEFARLKIGIGRPASEHGYENYVLGKFDSEDNEMIKQVVVRVMSALEVFAAKGVTEAQAQYNRKGLDI